MGKTIPNIAPSITPKLFSTNYFSFPFGNPDVEAIGNAWLAFTSIIYWQDWNISVELVHVMGLISCQKKYKHKKDRQKMLIQLFASTREHLCPLQFFYDWQIPKSVEKIPISPPGGKNRNLNHFQITSNPLHVPITQACLTVTFRPRIPSSILHYYFPQRGLNSITKPLAVHSILTLQSGGEFSAVEWAQIWILRKPIFSLGLSGTCVVKYIYRFPFIPRFNLIHSIHLQK